MTRSRKALYFALAFSGIMMIGHLIKTLVMDTALYTLPQYLLLGAVQIAIGWCMGYVLTYMPGRMYHEEKVN